MVRNDRRRRGFSLIEIIVALVILTIMSVTVSMAAVKHIQRAHKQKTIYQIGAIGDQVKIYRITEQKYPEELTDLVPEYVEKAEGLRDGWDNELRYSCPGENGDFDIVSGGPDGNLDTSEDNVNSWELSAKDAPQP
ncbi:MAG: type II secretion system protein GspG [Planctomycetota bacterium]